MTSLNTVFKRIYAEALEPYGYKKIKGRQPYFVRLIGDEIIHIITVAPEPTTIQRNFGIYGGAATVYRPRINLDRTPRDNFDWLISNAVMYRDSDIFEDRPDRFIGKYNYSYDKDSEKSLVESVQSSVLGTEQVLLEKLKKATDLRSCMDFFWDFQGFVVDIIDNENLGADREWDEWNEGLVNFKIFSNTEEYYEFLKKRYEESYKRKIYVVENGMRGGTVEEVKQGRIRAEEVFRQRVETFEKYMNGQNHERVIEELERRKNKNLDILRAYGFEI